MAPNKMLAAITYIESRKNQDTNMTTVKNEQTPGKTVLAMVVLVTFAAFTPVLAQNSQQKGASMEDQSWILQERTLPLPAAASDAIRASVAKAPQLVSLASKGNIVAAEAS